MSEDNLPFQNPKETNRGITIPSLIQKVPRHCIFRPLYIQTEAPVRWRAGHLTLLLHVASGRNGDHVLTMSCKISTDPSSRPAQLPITGTASSLGSASTSAPMAYLVPVARGFVSGCVWLCVSLGDDGLTPADTRVFTVCCPVQIGPTREPNRVSRCADMHTPPHRVSSLPASSVGAGEIITENVQAMAPYARSSCPHARISFTVSTVNHHHPHHHSHLPSWAMVGLSRLHQAFLLGSDSGYSGPQTDHRSITILTTIQGSRQLSPIWQLRNRRWSTRGAKKSRQDTHPPY